MCIAADYFSGNIKRNLTPVHQKLYTNFTQHHDLLWAIDIFQVKKPAKQTAKQIKSAFYPDKEALFL